MQRFPHRPVPRASSNPLVTSTHYSRRPGPLARPILFSGLWQRIREQHQRLQKVLSFCLRAGSGCRKFDHVSDVREELGWFTARQLYELQSLNLLHKIRRTGEPQALASQLSVNSALRSRSTRRDTDLALPRVRTNAGKRLPIQDGTAEQRAASRQARVVTENF